MNYVQYFEYILFHDYYELCLQLAGGKPKLVWHNHVVHTVTDRKRCFTKMLDMIRINCEVTFEVLEMFHAEHRLETPEIARYANNFSIYYSASLKPESIHLRLLEKNRWR